VSGESDIRYGRRGGRWAPKAKRRASITERHVCIGGPSRFLRTDRFEGDPIPPRVPMTDGVYVLDATDSHYMWEPTP
jgi:hypothetical protein